MRKRPPVCAGLVLMGRHLPESKTEERTVTHDVIVVGEILADLAIDGSTRDSICLFSPDRPAARE
jgi:hypothetical protein